MERSGEEVPRDPFGHVKIDKINPGEWFGSKFAERLDAHKVLVQKSGYFPSAAANQRDLELIKSMTDFAVDAALRGESGLLDTTRNAATNSGRSSSTGFEVASHSTSAHLGSPNCSTASASRALNSPLRTDANLKPCWIWTRRLPHVFSAETYGVRQLGVGLHRFLATAYRS